MPGVSPAASTAGSWSRSTGSSGSPLPRVCRNRFLSAAASPSTAGACAGQARADTGCTMRLPVFDRRRAGVLLHLGSLEAALGRGGRAFIDWLAAAGFTVWQILPLGPTGPDGSPYWVRSDFAGNPLYIDPEELPEAEAEDYPAFLEASKPWFEDYALFEVLSVAHDGVPWWSWPAPLRDRAPAAIEIGRAHV